MNRFSFPTTIHHGPGAITMLPDQLTALGIKRPLFVTDRGVATLPFFAQLVQQIGASGFTVGAFTDVFGNPAKSQVIKGVEAYRAYQSDGVIGIGGGAALDVAKAIILMVNHPGDLFEYEDDLPGARPFDQAIPPWIAVPTTAGTGSEVGRSSVIADDETHRKKIIFSPRLLAPVVLADPQLTVGLPGNMTAATGMDALTHNVEAFLAKAYHPICDGIALEGVRLVAGSLRGAYLEPNNLEARGSMLLASMMGAIAFQKGLGLVHSCAHALSTVTHMHHGLANGVMIDIALPFNIPSSADRFTRLANAIGLVDSSAQGFIDWLSQLKRDLGIPADLVDAGVSPEMIEQLVTVSIEDGCHPNNPHPVMREDFAAIFRKAFRI